MGDMKNLFGQEAVKKFKEIIDNERMCMFCTEANKLPLPARPMTVQEVDEEGNFWFFSARSSNKNKEIAQDDAVQLIFSNSGKSQYLSVYGHVDVYNDHAKIEELWNGFVKAWFEEGKNDPDLTLLRFRPSEAYYWDTKDGKIVSFIKIAIAAVTGTTHLDGSVEGNAMP